MSNFDALPAPQHVLSLRHVLSLHGDETCRKGHSLHGLSLLRQHHYNLSFPRFFFFFFGVCVCVCVCARVRARAHVYVFVCARAHTCVCVCVDVHLSVAPRAPACVLLCVVFIIPASVSARLKFCIARSSVSCMKHDYRYRD